MLKLTEPVSLIVVADEVKPANVGFTLLTMMVNVEIDEVDAVRACREHCRDMLSSARRTLHRVHAVVGVGVGRVVEQGGREPPGEPLLRFSIVTGVSAVPSPQSILMPVNVS